MRKQWKHILEILIVLGIFLSACGGGGASEQGSGPSPGIPVKMLSWTPPTAYTDSTPLNPTTELEYIEIYVKATDGFAPSDPVTAVVSAVDRSTMTSVTSFNLGLLEPYLSHGVPYFVSVRAVTVSGVKSDFSPSASFSL